MVLPKMAPKRVFLLFFGLLLNGYGLEVPLPGAEYLDQLKFKNLILVFNESLYSNVGLDLNHECLDDLVIILEAFEGNKSIPGDFSSTAVIPMKIPTPNGTSYTPVCDMENIDEQAIEVPYQGYIVCIVMGVIVGLGIIMSFLDYFIWPEKSDQRKKPLYEILMSFSTYRNIKEIFTVKNSQSREQIGPIHCIRFFSIAWVAMGHVKYQVIRYINNTEDYRKIVKNVLGQVVLNFNFSVDSFFFISGVLLAYTWFAKYNKDKEKAMSVRSWVLFYLHRIFRLAPPYYIATVFITWVYYCLIKNMPIYLKGKNEYGGLEVCKHYWWANFLFI
uniref:Acyltransferase 3 domain-containing protein n=1 Tax=Acrobeloides nanus TaxID=290746 RepID=A0A914CQR5_9BILA